jgi:hypothetical protein
MDTDELLLAELAQQTRALVAQNLRSKAVVVGRLAPLIIKANGLGHTHETIHRAIVDAGLSVTFGVYKTALHRWRKKSKVAHPGEPVSPVRSQRVPEQPPEVASPSAAQPDTERKSRIKTADDFKKLHESIDYSDLDPKYK